jgi:hypothetical protein
MLYESNPKHKEPWQPGRKGTICPPWSHEHVQKLLESSIQKGKKRFATFNQVAFAAQEHASDVWHGYPVPWSEVPYSIRKTWVNEGIVQRRSIKQYWTTLPPPDGAVEL